jgi:DNA-binding MarR family transcriptional regulator
MPLHPGDPGCICYRLRQTARLISRTYDHFLAPVGISIGQFGILATLAAMQGSSISELADVLQMERTTLTRNLLPLKKLGYIEIEEGDDKRAKSLCLTLAGEKTLSDARPLWHAAQQSVEQQLGKAEVQSLSKTLDGAMDRLSASSG